MILTLAPFLIIILQIAVLAVLLKKVFRVQSFSLWTVAGIVIIGALLGDFIDITWWSGLATFAVLVGISLSKKFKLSLPQVLATVAVLLAIKWLLPYLLIKVYFA